MHMTYCLNFLQASEETKEFLLFVFQSLYISLLMKVVLNTL